MILTIVSFIVVLSILVFFHELGHMLAARHVGVRVERFSIGFPPRAFGFRWGETDYIVSWLPLGGYVKLWGQNLDDEDPSHPANYAAKSKLQRLYILAAGPAMNLLLAFLIMPAVYVIGVEMPAYRQSEPVVQAVEQGSAAAQAGFEAGDRILAVAGEDTPTWNAVYDRLSTEAMGSGAVRFEVTRDGAQRTLAVDGMAFASSDGFGWMPLVQPVVGAFSPSSPARDAGMVQGDRIVAVNGQPVQSWDDLPPLVQQAQGDALTFDLRRDGQAMQVRVAPEYNESADAWLVGISPGTVTERFGPVAAVQRGTERVVSITGATFAFLGQMITGNGSMDAVGGPVKIGAIVGEAARTGVANVVFLMAIISLQLGIFNLLPIPALDGGHIFLLAVEGLNGKPLSPALRERMQMIGFSVLLLLILFVTYNDVLSLIS